MVMTQINDPEKSGSFLPILNVPDTVGDYSAEEMEERVRYTRKRNLSKLHELPDYGKYKGPEPLAIVAGGPSLNKTVEELRVMKRIMACGSAHDHIVRLGFKPDYCVICDPHPLTAGYLKNPQKDCTYLIATSCHQNLFDLLENHKVVVWNSAGPEKDAFNGEPMIQGGCTVTLRALNVAIVLGFLNLHFFGLDSSFETEEENHAYPHMDNGKRTLVQVAGGKVFQTTSPWLCQALHFQEQLRQTGHLFQPTVHGDGLIAEIMKQAEKDANNGL